MTRHKYTCHTQINRILESQSHTVSLSKIMVLFFLFFFQFLFFNSINLLCILRRVCILLHCNFGIRRLLVFLHIKDSYQFRFYNFKFQEEFLLHISAFFWTLSFQGRPRFCIISLFHQNIRKSQFEYAELSQQMIK